MKLFFPIKMRVLTYCNLKSLVKGVEKGFPLQIEIDEFEILESDYNEEFLQSILPLLDWNAIKMASDAVGLKDMPELWSRELLNDDDFLQAMHRLLLDIQVLEGKLTCPESGRIFPIVKGIPNMM
ncbi:Trm112 family protein [archaeon]|nr:MAG: Trm112 family protein [archaeon]